MNRFVHLAMTFVFAMTSAAGVAYALAHVVHHSLGVPGSALREQALFCAALIVGLITIEFLASRE